MKLERKCLPNSHRFHIQEKKSEEFRVKYKDKVIIAKLKELLSLFSLKDTTSTFYDLTTF